MNLHDEMYLNHAEAEADDARPLFTEAADDYARTPDEAHYLRLVKMATYLREKEIEARAAAATYGAPGWHISHEVNRNGS